MHPLSVAIVLFGVLVLQASACSYVCSNTLVGRVIIKENGEIVDDNAAYYCHPDKDFSKYTTQCIQIVPVVCFFQITSIQHGAPSSASKKT